MTIYYICRADDLADLELPQSDEELLACEIVIAADVFDDIKAELLAINADSENGTYAYLRGAALYSVELNASNIQIWKTEAEKIHEYLLGNEYGEGHLWQASRVMSDEVDDYESICKKTRNFRLLAKGFSHALASFHETEIRGEKMYFVKLLKSLYSIDEIKAVAS